MTNELELLKRATFEIRDLRSQNKLMAARLDTFDKCVLLLTANINGNNIGMSPDLVWEIEKFIDSKTTEIASNNN